jgi:hypothetical protein
VNDIAHVTYRVEFGSPSVVAAATERLASAGFTVAAPPDAATGLVVEARLTGEVDQADAALNQALAGVDHDPLIEWHVGKLTGFV